MHIWAECSTLVPLYDFGGLFECIVLFYFTFSVPIGVDKKQKVAQ